jgi:hypothetical protein
LGLHAQSGRFALCPPCPPIAPRWVCSCCDIPRHVDEPKVLPQAPAHQQTSTGRRQPAAGTTHHAIRNTQHGSSKKAGGCTRGPGEGEGEGGRGEGRGWWLDLPAKQSMSEQQAAPGVRRSALPGTSKGAPWHFEGQFRRAPMRTKIRGMPHQGHCWSIHAPFHKIECRSILRFTPSSQNSKYVAG